MPWSRSWTATPEPALPGACSSHPTERLSPRRSGSPESRPSSTTGCGWGSSPSSSRRGGSCSPSRAGAFPVDWVSGACLLLRRAVLEQIGLLDEGLYTYFDDPDICLRASRAGWETWYVPESQVIHLGGASTGLSGQRVAKRRPPYWHQARRRYFLKNHGPLYAAPGRRGIHLRLFALALRRLASAQAGYRPALHVDRLDPPQRLLHRTQGQDRRKPGAARSGSAVKLPRLLRGLLSSSISDRSIHLAQ